MYVFCRRAKCSCEIVTRCTCCLFCFAACCAQLLVRWLLVGCYSASSELSTSFVVLHMVIVFSNILHRTVTHGDAARHKPPRTGRLKHDGALSVHLLPVMLCCVLCSTACSLAAGWLLLSRRSFRFIGREVLLRDRDALHLLPVMLCCMLCSTAC